MIVLSASHLSFSVGDREILNDITFALNEGDRLGIIGVNGAGKTTLFRLLTGEYTPTSGSVFRAQEHTVGVLRQDEASEVMGGDMSLLSYVLSMSEQLLLLEKEIAALEESLTSLRASEGDEELMRLSARLAAAHERYAAEGGLEFRSRAHSMLTHMGFPEEEHARPVSGLSGGQHTRLALARLLAASPDILLLDEPTNHLDIDALLWLEDFLSTYEGTVLVISHDRYFLDRVTSKTLMIRYTRAKLYHGAYTAAKQAEAADEASHERQYKEQQKIIARIEANIAFQRRCGQAHNFVTIRAKQKQLDRMERVEALRAPERDVRFSFSGEQAYSQEVISAKELSFSYGGAPLLRSLSFLVKKDERVLLLGANGTGKSTLMKLLVGKLPLNGGKLRFGENVSIGYYDQETRSFDESKTVFEELHDEYPQKTVGEIRSALALFLFSGEDVDKPIRALSGGEKARLTLAKLILKPVNLLLLDEPTNHLDIGSREALETALIAFEGTVVAVSHDRYFIDRIGTRAIVLSPEREDGAESYTPYEDETLYACYLRHKTEAQNTLAPAVAVKNEGKEAFEREKQRKNEERNVRRKREKAMAEIPLLEDKIEKAKAELYGSAAADYLRAAALEEEIAAMEERLLTLYELIMD